MNNINPDWYYVSILYTSYLLLIYFYKTYTFSSMGIAITISVIIELSHWLQIFWRQKTEHDKQDHRQPSDDFL